MRLLLVTSFYPPLTGGGASRIYDFARLLGSMGFSVTVLTFLSIKRFKGFKPFGDGRVYVVRFPSLGFKHPIDQIFTSLMGTILILVMRKPHYVIVSVPPGEPCIGSYVGSRIFGRSLVVDIRDEWEDAVLKRTKRTLTRVLYRFYQILFTAIYRKSSFVATVSPTLVHRITERGIKEAFLLPNGADVKLFHPKSQNQRAEIRKALGLSEDDFVFVYAGVVGWYYRIDVVIKALLKLVGEQQIKNIKLFVIGGGNKLREYSELTEKLGLTDYVRFLGEKQRSEVAMILPCCDVGLIPFDEDPIWLSAYTTKLFEYAASGLPTIVSVVKGSDLEKLIAENEIGFRVEPLHVEQMAEVMLRAYKDKKRVAQMRTNAQKLAVERFNRETIVKKFAELLRAKS